MFVKRDCGCLGLHLGQACYVIKDCRKGEWGFHQSKDCAEKSYHPVPGNDIRDIVYHLNKLIKQGQDLDIIRTLLK